APGAGGRPHLADGRRVRRERRDRRRPRPLVRADAAQPLRLLRDLVRPAARALRVRRLLGARVARERPAPRRRDGRGTPAPHPQGRRVVPHRARRRGRHAGGAMRRVAIAVVSAVAAATFAYAYNDGPESERAFPRWLVPRPTRPIDPDVYPAAV